MALYNWLFWGKIIKIATFFYFVFLCTITVSFSQINENTKPYIQIEDFESIESIIGGLSDRKRNIIQANLYQVDELYKNIYDDPEFNWRIQLRSRHAANIAQLCFQSGTHIEFAKDLIRKIIAMQVIDKHNPFFGNFRDHYDAENVRDQNLARFILPALIYIYRVHYDYLDSTLRKELEQTLYRGHQAVLFLERSRIPVWYSNVYMKIIGTLVMLEDQQNALVAIQKLYDFTRDYGINEYGQWNYVVLQLAGLQMAYNYASDPGMKSMLGELLEFYWWDTVHNIHLPTKMYSSTSSRARGERGLVTGDRIQTLLYLYFGIGDADDFPLTGHQILLSDYQPPRDIIEFFINKMSDGPFSYQMKYGKVEMQAYQTNTFSLATQTGRRSAMGMRHTGKTLLSSERNEITAQINVKNSGYAGIRFRVNSVRSDFDRFQITSLQNKNKAVISYNFDLHGINSRKMNNAIYSYGELGHPDAIDTFLVNGKEWNYHPLSLGNDDWIVYSIGPNFVGLRFLESDVIHIDNHDVISKDKPVLLGKNKDMVFLKNFIVYDKPESGNLIHGVNNNGRRLGYVLIVSNKDAYHDLHEFSNDINKIYIDQNINNSIHHVEVLIPSNINDVESFKITENVHDNIVVSRKINDKEVFFDYLIESDYMSVLFGSDSNKNIIGDSGILKKNSTSERYEYHFIYPEEMYIYTPHLNNRDVTESFLNWQISANALQLEYEDGDAYLQTTRYKEGIAERTVTISRNDHWKIWLKVYWPGWFSNSFDVNVNKANSHFFSSEGIGMERYRIESDSIQTSYWIATSKTYFLNKGFHIISVSGVDRYAVLKGIILTNDPAFDPNQQEIPN